MCPLKNDNTVPSSSITQLSSLLLLLSLTSSGGGVWCGTSFPPNGFTIVVVARLTLFFNEYENQIPACVPTGNLTVGGAATVQGSSQTNRQLFTSIVCSNTIAEGLL
eukprot:scaffold6472_cov208-Alexandrium_tamarense.AAC.2